MPDDRLRWLYDELRRIRTHIYGEIDRVREIQAQINTIEREHGGGRHLRSIHGGAMLATGAAAAVTWIRDHPAATSIAVLATAGIALGLIASSPWSVAPPHAAQPPAATAPPPPVPTDVTSTTTSGDTTRPQASDDEDDALNVTVPVPAPRAAPRPALAVAPTRTSQPATTSPVRPPVTTTPRPPATPTQTAPLRPDCTGVHLNLPPLADACLLG